MPTYTHRAGTKVDSASAAMDVPYPTGPTPAAGEMLICFLQARFDSTISTAPTGFTLLESQNGPGAGNPTLWLYGKIAAGTETGTISVDTSSTGGQAAQIVAFPAPSGYSWPAIGTAYIGATKSLSTTGLPLKYGARSGMTNGRLVIAAAQVEANETTTAIATTGGWTQCADFRRLYLSDAAAQFQEVSGNVVENVVTRTGVSTSGQSARITAEFAPTAASATITSATPATKKPGDLITCSLTNYGSAPLSANCSLNGVALTLEAGATSSSCTFYVPAETTFRPAGSHVATPWGTNVNLVIANATDTATISIQITAPIPEHWGVLVSGFETTLLPGAAAIGDHCYFSTALTNVLTDATYGTLNPRVALPLTVVAYLYDVSAVAWLSESTTFDLEAVVAPQFVDTFTDTNGTIPSAHTPDTNEFGGAWSAVEKEYAEQSTPVGGVTIQSNELSINTLRGVSYSIGNNVHRAQVKWRVATLSDGLSIHIGRLNDQNYLNLYMTADFGQTYTIQQKHNNVLTNIIATQAFPWSTGRTYTIDFKREANSTVEVKIDGLVVATGTHPSALNSLATRVGVYASGSTAYLPGLSINADLPGGSDPVMTFDDVTVTPGQTVVATISPALASAVNSVTLNGVTQSFTGASTTGFTFVIPAIANYVAGGSHVATPWYENIAVSATNGAATVVTTLQIVAPIPANYGTVIAPPWKYFPSGAKEGDRCFVEIVSGAGTATPKSFDFIESENTIVHIYCFNVASVSWLARRVVQLPKNGVNTDQIVTGMVKRLVKSTVKVIS